MNKSLGRVLGILATAAVVGVVAVVGARRLATWAGSLGRITDVTAPADVVPGQPVDLEIPKGATARDIGAILAEHGVVSSSVGFEVAVRRRDVGSQLQAGPYRLETGMDADGALDVLLEGPIVETYRVTVREGLWIGEILETVAEQSPWSVDELAASLTKVTSPLHEGEVSDPVTWEGLLFPDTYEFATDAMAEEVLQRMADTMVARVDSIDWAPLESHGLDRRDGIIIASMVEAEARLSRDRPLIASVIVNRLEIDMPLQIDATVIYALGDRGRKLSRSDLDVDSPYNTYRVVGLPPGPIGAPGLESLQAAAAPATTEYLYYVLTDAEGGHSFATTYEEFQRLKAKAKAEGILP